MGKSKAILPRGGVKRVMLRDRQAKAVETALDTTAERVQKDFLKTVRTWENPAGFDILVKQHRRDVVTSDPIYVMLDRGTRAHLILPRRAKYLRFTTPFAPKTTPQTIGSRAGSKGDTVNFRKGVNHPGTEARDWALTIAVKWIDQIGRIFSREIRKALP